MLNPAVDGCPYLSLISPGTRLKGVAERLQGIKSNFSFLDEHDPASEIGPSPP